MLFARLSFIKVKSGMRPATRVISWFLSVILRHRSCLAAISKKKEHRLSMLATPAAGILVWYAPSTTFPYLDIFLWPSFSIHQVVCFLCVRYVRWDLGSDNKKKIYIPPAWNFPNSVLCWAYFRYTANRGVWPKVFFSPDETTASHGALSLSLSSSILKDVVWGPYQV